MSILAHLVGGEGERGATRALAYLLNRHAELLGAFVNNLPGAAGIQFDPRPRVESETGGDGGRPDMRIYDVERNLRTLVENKFWAGLTDAQPVGYFNMLPDDMSSGLLFIVPRQRVNVIWSQLQARCQDAELDLGQGLLGGDRVKWVPAGAQRTMLVTDWENVLDVLEGAADGPEVRSDLFQFRRLIEKFDAEAFLPLRSDEVTNVDVAKRMSAYVGLIDSICERLYEENVTSYGQFDRSRPYQAFHRNLTWTNGSHDWAALTCSFRMWRESGGITPLWLWVSPTFPLPDDFVRDGVQEPDSYNKFIPICLKLGVERDRVVEDAVEQIRRMLT